MQTMGAAVADRKGEAEMASRDGVAEGMANFIDRLSPTERDSLLGVLRDSRTFLAEDLTDVIAILRSLED
jgi:hypothetical protein